MNRLAAALLFLFTAVVVAGDPPSVGLEGEMTVVLPRSDIVARPLDDRAPVLVRILGQRPQGSNFIYDIHYTGFEPRAHDLAAALMTQDGQPLEGITNLQVTVRSILPADHDGKLPPALEPSFPWPGGYRAALWVAAILWVAGLLALTVRRRPAPPPPPPPPVPPPSLAELLRPLVEAAAAGRLDAAGKAELERMLLGYWRERLALQGLDVPEALRRMKADSRAGALLRALEAWLHSPRGAGPGEVDRLLRDYTAPGGPGA